MTRWTMGLLALAAVLAAAGAAQAQQKDFSRGVLKSVYGHALDDCRKDPRFKDRTGACEAYATCVSRDADLKLTQEQAMQAVHDKDVKLEDSLPIRRWKAVSDRCHDTVTSPYRN